MKTHVIPLIQNLQYRRLLGDIDDAFLAWSAMAGHAVRCRRGCDACCHGPFDVSSADLWLLAEGLAGLAPEARARVLRSVRQAANEQRAALAQAGTVLDETPSVEAVGEEAFDAFCDALVDQPCPLLEAGACVLYDARPEPCRWRGATWVDGADELEMGCPVGLNDAAPVARGAWIDVSERVARLESRSYAAVNDARERTTIALGLDALLRRG